MRRDLVVHVEPPGTEGTETATSLKRMARGSIRMIIHLHPCAPHDSRLHQEEIDNVIESQREIARRLRRGERGEFEFIAWPALAKESFSKKLRNNVPCEFDEVSAKEMFAEIQRA